MQAGVVAALGDGIALAVEGNPDEMLARLLARPAVATAADEQDSPEKSSNTWDRVRGLSQTEKILLAVKADRTERALLLQDNDPRVLLSVLRNPRLTVDEVGRLAKASFLNYQIAEVITKPGQWMARGNDWGRSFCSLHCHSALPFLAGTTRNRTREDSNSRSLRASALHFQGRYDRRQSENRSSVPS